MTEPVGAVEGGSATRTLGATKTIALVAHDHMMDALLSWAKARRRALRRHALVGTGTTGELIARHTGLTVERRLSH
jgi:methylglyoxal synthase